MPLRQFGTWASSTMGPPGYPQCQTITNMNIAFLTSLVLWDE